MAEPNDELPQPAIIVHFNVQAEAGKEGEQRHREEWPTLWKLLDLKLADVRSREGA